MPTKTLLEIVREYLARNYYDGLYNEYSRCACRKSELSPGECINADCTAGIYHSSLPDYEFRIGKPHNGWIAERISKEFAGSCGDLDPET